MAILLPKIGKKEKRLDTLEEQESLGLTEKDYCSSVSRNRKRIDSSQSKTQEGKRTGQRRRKKDISSGPSSRGPSEAVSSLHDAALPLREGVGRETRESKGEQQLLFKELQTPQPRQEHPKQEKIGLERPKAIVQKEAPLQKRETKATPFKKRGESRDLLRIGGCYRMRNGGVALLTRRLLLREVQYWGIYISKEDEGSGFWRGDGSYLNQEEEERGYDLLKRISSWDRFAFCVQEIVEINASEEERREQERRQQKDKKTVDEEEEEE